ncbi:MAG: alpha/beta hydrolase [Microcystaceae cyanobacterium]
MTKLFLQASLKASRQNPEDVRKVLVREADVDVVTLDQALNNPVGDLLLDQINLVVHPPAKVVNRQAIRSALVLSASEDNKVSLIEVIQNYPTSEVEVEGERIVQAYRQISALSGRVRNLADDLMQIF